MRLPEAVVSERDAQFWAARQNGLSFRQIAKAHGVSVDTAHKGFMRHQKKMAKLSTEEAQLAVWDTLAQLDALLVQLFPMCRQRKVDVVQANGAVVQVDVAPSMEAIDRVIKIINQKGKYLGMEKDVIQFTQIQQEGPGLTNDQAKEITPEIAAKQFAAELIKHGVMTGPHAEMIEKFLATNDQPDIVDAEIVEPDMLELSPVEEALPPPWIDDDDEYHPGSWVPDDLDDGDTKAR